MPNRNNEVDVPVVPNVDELEAQYYRARQEPENAEDVALETPHLLRQISIVAEWTINVPEVIGRYNELAPGANVQGDVVGGQQGIYLTRQAPAPEVDIPQYGSPYRLQMTYKQDKDGYVAWNRRYGIVVEAATIEELKDKAKKEMHFINENNNLGFPDRFDIRLNEGEPE